MSRFVVEIIVEGAVDMALPAAHAERAEQMAESRLLKRLQRAGILYPTLRVVNTYEEA